MIIAKRPRRYGSLRIASVCQRLLSKGRPPRRTATAATQQATARVQAPSKCNGHLKVKWPPQTSLARPKVNKEGWSCAACPPQRSLRAALGCHPTTAGGAQFCLLCCQPGPVPESLPARPPLLTQGCPCSPPVWLGHPIHTASRTCHGPQRFISQVPMWGTGRHDSPQQQRHRPGVPPI